MFSLSRQGIESDSTVSVAGALSLRPQIGSSFLFSNILVVRLMATLSSVPGFLDHKRYFDLNSEKNSTLRSHFTKSNLAKKRQLRRYSSILRKIKTLSKKKFFFHSEFANTRKKKKKISFRANHQN